MRRTTADRLGTCALTALCLVVLAKPSFAQGQITWLHDLQQAQQAARQSNRLVLAHFSASWCGPCKRMKRDVMPQPQVKQVILEHFIPVELDFDQQREIARSLEVDKIPTDLIMTPDGKVVARLQGLQPAARYSARLSQVAAEFAPKDAVAQANSAAQPTGGQHRMADQNPVGGPDSAGNGSARADAYSTLGGDFANRLSGPRYGQDAGQQPSAHAPSGTGTGNAIQPQRESPFGAAPNRNQQDIQAAPQDGSAAGGQQGQLGRDFDPRDSQRPPVAQTPQIPRGNPPLAMEGFCPVQLAEQKAWMQGDPRWGAIHRGRTFLFAGPAQQQRFLAQPERYAPVAQGDDPVMILEHGRRLRGRREHGLFFQGRVYLFVSEQTLSTFQQNPGRYTAEALEARRPERSAPQFQQGIRLHQR